MLYNGMTSLHFYLYDNRRSITTKSQLLDVRRLCREWEELSNQEKMLLYVAHVNLSAIEVDSLNTFILRVKPT